MDIAEIRDYLVVITTSLTILGVFIRTLNNFFLDVMKNKFRLIPGKQNIFDTVLKGIFYTLFAIEIFVVFAMLLIYLYINHGDYGNPTDTKSFVSVLIATGVLIGLIYLIMATGIIAAHLTNKVEKILGRENLPKVKSKKIVNRMLLFLKKIISKIKIKEMFSRISLFKKMSISNVNRFNIIISIAFIAINIIAITIYFLVGIDKQDIINVISLGFIGAVCLGMFIISNSMNPIIDMVDNKCGYYIKVKSDTSIICDFFLEYSDYYLIIEGGVERYINKQEVREIKKTIER